MRKIRGYFLLCFLAQILNPIYAHDQELFLDASAHYKEGKYAESFALFDQIAKKGIPVLVALGNCSYYLHKPLDALIFWTQAERGASFNEYCLLQKNKNYAYISLNKEPSELPVIQLCIEFLIRSLPPLSLQLLLISCWLILLASLWLSRGKMRILIASITATFMLCTGCVLYIDYKMRTTTYGYVVTADSPLFVGPNSAYHQIGNISQATLCEICDQQNGWCKVRSKSLVGWISEDVVRQL